MNIPFSFDSCLYRSCTNCKLKGVFCDEPYFEEENRPSGLQENCCEKQED